MQAEALLDHSKFVRDLAASLTFANEDPEDVVQEAWLAALRHPPEVGPGARGWLATVVRNVLRQSRRSGARRAVREVTAAHPRSVPTPDEIREREEVRGKVVDAVLSLDDPYRTAVLLRYYEELPPREIAKRTGDPVETVKTRLARARAMLRKRLDDRHRRDGLAWGFAVAELALWPGAGKAPPPVVGTLTWAKIAAVLVGVAVVAGVGVTAFWSPSPETRPDPVAAVPGPEDPAMAGEPDKSTLVVPGEGAPEAAGEASAGEGEPPAAGAAEAKPTALIEGVVRDEETGKPLPQAQVRLAILSERARFRDTRTDAKGHYRFDAVPHGVKVRVFVRGRGRVVRVLRSESDRVLKRGEAVLWDLAARQREGIDLRILVQVPEGATIPEEVQITRTTRYETGEIIESDKARVDPATRIMTLFLEAGTHSLAVQAPGFAGWLGPIVVEGDGPPREVVLQLERRAGLRLRLVTESGQPLRRGPIPITVFAKTENRIPGGSVNFSVDGLGRHETDERGELDLTGILPALDERSGYATAFAFVVEAEGIFRGSGEVPNWEISTKEILRRWKARDAPVVVLDLPALPHKAMQTIVMDSNGDPVSGVRVAGEPAECFVGKEFVSGADGRLEYRLRTLPAGSGPRLVAKSPWIGRTTLMMLTIPRPPGAPPAGLVVSRPREVRLRLVDDLGEAISRLEVKVGSRSVTTDEAGCVRIEVAKDRKKVKIRAPGHLPEEVPLKPAEVETVVRLDRARAVVVKFRGPDGKHDIVPIVAREKGSGRFFPVTKHDEEAKTLTLLLPRRTITISVHPTYVKLVGSVVAEPDAGEVELVLRTP